MNQTARQINRVLAKSLRTMRKVFLSALTALSLLVAPLAQLTAVPPAPIAQEVQAGFAQRAFDTLSSQATGLYNDFFAAQPVAAAANEIPLGSSTFDSTTGDYGFPAGSATTLITNSDIAGFENDAVPVGAVWEIYIQDSTMSGSTYKMGNNGDGDIYLALTNVTATDTSRKHVEMNNNGSFTATVTSSVIGHLDVIGSPLNGTYCVIDSTVGNLKTDSIENTGFGKMLLVDVTVTGTDNTLGGADGLFAFGGNTDFINGDNIDGQTGTDELSIAAGSFVSIFDGTTTITDIANAGLLNPVSTNLIVTFANGDVVTFSNFESLSAFDTSTVNCPSTLGPDSDGDGILNDTDTDDDNDGILDTAETGDTDGDGIPDSLESNIIDTDGDGNFDHNDANADGDGEGDDGTGGEQDGVETGVWNDNDGDGIPAHLDPNDSTAGAGDADGDGFNDDVECPDGYICPDNDGDGIPGYMDADEFPPAPGGVSPNLALWLKADAGVSGSGTVTGWTDQTGTNNFTVSGDPQTGCQPAQLQQRRGL